MEVNPFYMEIAENAYSHYGAVTDFKNFQGNPMPKFSDLPDTIKKAWHDAARYCYNLNSPRAGVASPSWVGLLAMNLNLFVY